MIYLASPYSHPDPAVRDRRAHLAAVAASLLTEHVSHTLVYSPIVHGHALVTARELPLDWTFWRRRCRVTVERANEVALLLLDGWWSSVGMATEYRWATELGIPVRFYLLDLDPLNRSVLIETRAEGPPVFSVEARP